jgi:hypothetical protein
MFSTLPTTPPQGSGDPAAGEAWMLKMSEWAPQSLGGSMSAGEALDPKGDEGKLPIVERSLNLPSLSKDITAVDLTWNGAASPQLQSLAAKLVMPALNKCQRLVRSSAGNFSRIIVYDRASHRLVEEQISATLVLAMRNMYQSKVGFTTLQVLQSCSTVWCHDAHSKVLLGVVIGETEKIGHVLTSCLVPPADGGGHDGDGCVQHAGADVPGGGPPHGLPRIREGVGRLASATVAI